MKILLIDNYDSFTFNLVQYLGILGYKSLVYRHDDITLDEIKKMKPDRIIISPGPCTPKESGISLAVIESFSATIPILGVCLGHQAIAHVFGGKIIRAPKPCHGKTSSIQHNGEKIFQNIPSPFRVTRYHSLVIEPDSLPKDFEVSAWYKDEDNTCLIMAIQHKTYPLYGVQFHPEALLTQYGHTLLKNFVVYKH